ncbi:MAG: aldolase/citrate lyase family protein [Pedobacter sp.]|uniref:HpcH/HpaI aldolase family protein n=1 Tax=Pedobacter sp. TaxID=1411316 RepID=UPI002807889E|nr:aldolase/citrate lyase family protein [Pedobacter sp.]MDQ8006064.1 aldolase/citrate lyase family protein [Pedobacter sp.]
MANTNTFYGTWLTAGNPALAELASMYNFDWFLFDLEHGFLTVHDLLGNLQAVKNSATKNMVRVGGVDPIQIAKVLDLGANGIMVPHVSNAVLAKTCVDAMLYPPYGHRGFSSSVRAFNYGLNVPSDIHADKPVLLVQIEDVEGVKNADSIAAVDGVDVLFVGPADLKLSLKHQEKENAISYEEALQTVINAVKKNGKLAGILVRSLEDTSHLIEMGFTYIALSSDTAILKSGYQNIVKFIDELKK